MPFGVTTTREKRFAVVVGQELRSAVDPAPGICTHKAIRLSPSHPQKNIVVFTVRQHDFRYWFCAARETNSLSSGSYTPQSCWRNIWCKRRTNGRIKFATNNPTWQKSLRTRPSANSTSVRLYERLARTTHADTSHPNPAFHKSPASDQLYSRNNNLSSMFSGKSISGRNREIARAPEPAE